MSDAFGDYLRSIGRIHTHPQAWNEEDGARCVASSAPICAWL
jgi:hypothetical protein